MTKFLISAQSLRAVAAVSIAATTGFTALALAEEARIPAGVFTNAQTSDQYLAKDQLIGAKVHGADGKIIGDIEDLIINDYNLVTGVVMGTGGFLGVAEKKIGVNVQALKFGEKDGKPEISLPEATPEVLAAVQAYERMQPKKSLLERAKEKAQELTDKSTASAKSAAEGAKPTLDSAVEKTKETYEKAKEAAKPMLDTATEKTKEAYEKAKDAAGSAVDSAKKAIDDATAPAPAPEAPKP